MAPKKYHSDKVEPFERSQAANKPREALMHKRDAWNKPSEPFERSQARQNVSKSKARETNHLMINPNVPE